jgi:type I restriction enzyme S subunit
MTEELKPYPAMKDSGALLPKQIPAHWELRRLRNVADLRVSNIDKKTDDDGISIRLCNYVDVYKNEIIRVDMPFMPATATAAEIARFRLSRGDVLITKDSEDWRDIAVPAYVAEQAPDLVCGYHLAILRPFAHVIEGRYLYWQLLSEASQYQFRVSANGITRYGLSHGAIKEVLFTVPPLDEQRGIVRFLDHADRLIRRSINAKRKLIKLLGEQKQAIIHRAVTRGLDPNVHLKPSGVDWLGEVPVHWQIKRNGQLFAQRNETGFPNLPILEVSLRTGIRIRDFETSMRKQVMTDRSKYKRAAAGDIAYNMMRMWQGAVGRVPVDGLVSPAYIVARPLVGADSRYFSNLFRTSAYMNEVDKYSRGIVKDRNRLYWEDFKQMPSPYPPEAEQATIAQSIQQQTQGADDAIGRTRDVIADIYEYRTRLISEVVTGKLDVRDAAAVLPDEVDQPEEMDVSEVADDELDDVNEDEVEEEEAA